jgi:hypothetical protein
MASAAEGMSTTVGEFMTSSKTETRRSKPMEGLPALAERIINPPADDATAIASRRLISDAR